MELQCGRRVWPTTPGPAWTAGWSGGVEGGRAGRCWVLPLLLPPAPPGGRLHWSHSPGDTHDSADPDPGGEGLAGLAQARPRHGCRLSVWGAAGCWMGRAASLGSRGWLEEGMDFRVSTATGSLGGR